MKNFLLSYGRFIFLSIVCCFGYADLALGQNFYDLIERCGGAIGEVKTVVTRQKENFLDYQSPIIKRIDEYNKGQQLVRSIIYRDRLLAKKIEYVYLDSLLIYERHQQPKEDDYLLVYQYLQKKIPRKILRVTPDRKIINYARLEYTKDFVPVYMSFYNLLGELLEKRSLEYYGKNHLVIGYTYPEHDFSRYQKFERLCKYNSPDLLKKRDFKDVITRPINIQKEDKMIRIIKAVADEKRERIEIDELFYDDYGNWIAKKTYHLRKKKTKKKLVGEIEREIEYYN